jgi:hypothetical protein
MLQIEQIVRICLVGKFAVEDAMLTNSQTTPRSVSGHWLDGEVRGICLQRLECLLSGDADAQ